MCKVIAENVSVELLIRSGHPDSVNAEVIEVAFIDLLGDTGKVTTVEGCSGITGNGLDTVVSTVVGGIAVAETVCQQEVNRSVIP